MNDRKWQLKSDWRFSWHRWKQHRAFTFLALVTLIICLISNPLAKASIVATKADTASSALPCDVSSAQLTKTQPTALFEQGRQCYEAGVFDGAEAMWSAAAKAYAQTGDRTGEISSQLNQSQALKALGNYSLALNVLEDLDKTVPDQPPFQELKAKVLRSLGDVYLLISNSGAAREKLQQSFQIAQALKADEAISGACFSIGLVDRAEINSTLLQSNDRDAVLTQQTQVMLALQAFQAASQTAPTPISKAQAELNQLSLLASALPSFNTFLSGLSDDALRQLTRLPKPLQSALAPAPESIAPFTCTAIAPTQPTAALSNSPDNQKLAIIRNQTVQLTDALLTAQSQVKAQLPTLPHNRLTIDARINFAQSLIKLKTVAASAAAVDRHFRRLPQTTQLNQAPSTKQLPDQKQTSSSKATPVNPSVGSAKVTLRFLPANVQAELQALSKTSFKDAVRELEQAIAEAQSLPNDRSEALARVTLAELYTSVDRWQEVETLSQQALTLATKSNATPIISQAQRQLARAYQKQGKIRESRASCKVAANTLQSLRGDLVAVNQNANQDVQFNFRDKVEPFYRECAATLLPSEHEDQNSDPVQQNLEAARNMIESLQLAEIDDFLREACIQGQKVQIDKLVEQNPKTAFIYAIVFSDRTLSVIAKIPDQKESIKKKALSNSKESAKTKLLYKSVELSGQETIPVILKALREQLKTKSGDNKQQLEAASNTVYQWLITPFKEQLTNNQEINTLVFVLDEGLRSIPMAALYNKDSKRYLIQDYAVAISPGLQLLDSKPIAQEKLNVFAAGLSEIPPDFKELFAPLPGVETELKFMEEAKVITRPLRNDGFQKKAFADALNNTPFNVVHLATHGQFSSTRKDNYILAFDGKLDVTELSTILRSRSQTRDEPIELLVLSACETAKGDNRATLGLAGFALKSGVRSTLASLWSVTDGSTAPLMKKFYEVLRDSSLTKGDAKLTKARALQLAQQELLKPEYDYSPSQWAPYVLFGNWL